MQIQKVLTSPAYNISDRSAGWSVKAGITNNYMQGDMPEGVDADVTALISDMKAGKVGAVIAYNVNPVYNLAQGAEFASALTKVDLCSATALPSPPITLCSSIVTNNFVFSQALSIMVVSSGLIVWKLTTLASIPLSDKLSVLILQLFRNLYLHE